MRRLARSDAFQRSVSWLSRVVLGGIRGLGHRRAEKLVRAGIRLIGPMMPENRTARDNIAAAFPGKAEEERKAILRGCWDNFALVIVEFLFLEDLAAGFDPERPDDGRVVVSGVEEFARLRDDGKPAVIVAGHLANWELLAVIARKYGLETVVPFRAPANVHFARDLLSAREELMGRLVANSRGAAFEIGAAMEQGAHLGMLCDQHYRRGITVPFLGRPARTNTLAARFARQYDCPVHGARAIRLADGRMRLELTAELDMPRDAEGLIDVEAATARIADVIGAWVREHPEQYFWVHDRWKM